MTETKKTIFTIVTPSYNQGQFIEQTIQSVLSQVGNFSIDYIIADGGSTDNSVEIIKKYAELLKKNLYPIGCNGIDYRWWSRADGGQADALNQGFALTNGTILAWINSDDFYEAGAFQKVADAFRKEPSADLIYGNGRALDRSILISVVTPKKITYRRLLFRGCEIFQPSAFFTKESFLRAGGIDETLSYAFDYDFWLKLLKRGKAFYVYAYLSCFRRWPESKTTTSLNKFIAEEKIVLKRRSAGFFSPYHFFMFKRALKKLFSNSPHTSV